MTGKIDLTQEVELTLDQKLDTIIDVLGDFDERLDRIEQKTDKLTKIEERSVKQQQDAALAKAERDELRGEVVKLQSELMPIAEVYRDIKSSGKVLRWLFGVAMSAFAFLLAYKSWFAK